MKKILKILSRFFLCLIVALTFSEETMASMSYFHSSDQFNPNQHTNNFIDQKNHADDLWISSPEDLFFLDFDRPKANEEIFTNKLPSQSKKRVPSSMKN